jgi:hypothetical protein
MKIKIGDKASISGSLTGYGDLEGYISDINTKYNLIRVYYTEESRQIAKQDGIVGKESFFEKIHKNGTRKI